MNRFGYMPRIVIALLMIVMLIGCNTDRGDYLNIAQSTFESISRGDASAAKAIDWTTFRINDEDIGPSFMQLTTPFEKDGFQKATLARITNIYSARGWSPEKMTNWTVQSQGLESGTVTADAPGGSIVTNMQKRGGTKKIVWIQIK